MQLERSTLSSVSETCFGSIYIYTKNSRLISERCGLTAFLSGSLLHIYEKQTT